MKDNFSHQSEDYSKFRPTYPSELVEKIVSLAPEKKLALDVATGNGQFAAAISKYFETVHATDISDNQLLHAKRVLNVIYKKMPAETTDFEDDFFDLITVAQAVHWFDFDVFYKEIHRILKPDGIFAIIGYGLMNTNPETDKIIHKFYHEVVGPFWGEERKYLDENYETIPFPFDEIQMEQHSSDFHWTFEQLIGYLETWSAVQHYKAHHNQNPLDLIRDELKISWEKSDKKISFPMLLRVGTKFNLR